MNELLISLVVGVVGSYLTYYFTNKSKRNETITKFKEEKYSHLLLKLQGFIGVTTRAKMKRDFFEELYQSWLYCSDEVVEALLHLVNLIKESHGKIPNPEEGRKAVGNIVLAMRKDLLGKTKLGHLAFQYTDVLE
jgi:hypothetical protein